MKSSLNGLEICLEHLFDYAGMFPPASLSFEDALELSAGFLRTLRRPSMVAADIVVGFDYLKRFNDGLLRGAGFEDGQLVKIAILGAPLNSLQAVISQERLDEMTALREFNVAGMQSAVRQQIVSYEIKIDRTLNRDLTFIETSIRNIKTYLREERIVFFLEPDLTSDTWQDDVAGISSILRHLNSVISGPLSGLKVRGSGPTALSSGQLAWVIDHIADLAVNFKATAGLHHPLVEAERYGNSLGFLGLVTSLYLRKCLGRSEFGVAEIEKCLTSSNLSEFSLGDNFGWSDYRLPARELADQKSKFHFSIGSCSLHEPDEDLARILG